MNVRRTFDLCRKIGFNAAVTDIWSRGVIRSGGAAWLVLQWPFHVQPPPCWGSQAMTCHWPGMNELLDMIAGREEELDIDAAFIADAYGLGHRPCVTWRDGQVAAYQWYATSGPVLDEDKGFFFKPGHVYVYKAFTHPDHRGQGLYQQGLRVTARAFHAEGKLGLLALVRPNNYPSLHGLRAVGFRLLGSAVHLRTTGWSVVGSSREANVPYRVRFRSGQMDELALGAEQLALALESSPGLGSSPGL